MSAAHTPGPWFVYQLHPDRFTVGNRSPSGVCRVTARCDPIQCITGAGDETMTDAECEANARLMSVAPDMSVALIALLDLHHQGQVSVRAEAAGYVASVIEAGEAAIDKALGEQQ
jgi:hypothetical protein